MQPTFHLDRVSKRFGPTAAVDGLTLQTEGPGLIALLGPNGAGKTTTMRMLTGAISPDSGRLTVAGHAEPSRSLAARRSVGFLAEFAAVYPEMSVDQFLSYRSKLWNMPRGPRCKRCAEVIDLCDLRPVARQRVGTLSKGYRQRVGLAAALLPSPSVLIMDEPTSGFDPEQAAAFRALVVRLAETAAVLLSSHLLGEVEAIASRVIVLRHGRIVFDGPAIPDAQGSSTVEVECAADPDLDPETDLSRLAGRLLAAGLREVRDGRSVAPGWLGFTVSGDEGRRDVPEAVGAVLLASRRAVRRLSSRHAGLEQRFASLMADREAAP